MWMAMAESNAFLAMVYVKKYSPWLLPAPGSILS
jgi:hypothetical protein